jgi:hypothetical protein
MGSLLNGPIGATAWFTWWQGVLLVVLIALIIVFFQLRKRQQ